MSLFRNSNSWKTGGLAVVVILSAMMIYKLLLPGGLTQFGGFGEAFENRYIDTVHSVEAYIKPNSGGYDGQFYAQIAVDPALNHPSFKEAIDEPAYRSRRILLPLIAHLLAFGNPEASILIYCGLNILCWFAFAWLIWNWLSVDNARTFARWVACVLSMGVLDSIKYSLTDLPSMLLILLMVRYANTRRLGVAGGFLAAVFVKETNLLAIASMPRWSKKPGRLLKELGIWGMVAGFSLFVFYQWYRYVNWKFGVFYGVSGNFDWPFLAMAKGFVEAVQHIASGNFDDRYIFRILAAFGFLIQLGWFITNAKKLENPLIRLGLVYGFLFIFLGDLVWSGYWAVCRVALPMTIAFNLLFTPKRYFWTGLVLANLTVIHSVYRFM